jgi:hypothetical protein
VSVTGLLTGLETGLVTGLETGLVTGLETGLEFTHFFVLPIHEHPDVFLHDH